MDTPPPILEMGKVVAFANADESVVRLRSDLIYVDGKPVDDVAKFAICKYPIGNKFYLCFCDDNWSMLAGSPDPSIEACKRQAEKEYRGLTPLWQPFHHVDEAAIDRICLEPLCSFCGKSFLETERMVEGKNAWICDACVRDAASSLGSAT